MTADERSPLSPRYPRIVVEDFGRDGNAFALMGQVTRALRRGGVDAATIKEFTDEATSGDYDHLVQTCMAWVELG